MHQSSNVAQQDSGRTVQLNVRIQEALRKRVEHARIDRNMSPAEFVTDALERYLAAPENASGDKSAPGGPGAPQSSKQIGEEGTGR